MSRYDVKQEVTDKYSLRGRVFHKLREDILNGKYKENSACKTEKPIGYFGLFSETQKNPIYIYI